MHQLLVESSGLKGDKLNAEGETQQKVSPSTIALAHLSSAEYNRPQNGSQIYYPAVITSPLWSVKSQSRSVPKDFDRGFSSELDGELNGGLDEVTASVLQPGIPLQAPINTK